MRLRTHGTNKFFLYSTMKPYHNCTKKLHTITQTPTPLVHLGGIFAEHNIRHVHMLVTTIHLIGDFIDQFALYESGALLLNRYFFRSVGDGNHDEGL